MPAPTDLPTRLRELYVQHGTNCVQEAADEIERLTALTWCGCGDQFTAHDPGACGNCVAAHDKTSEIEHLQSEVERLQAENQALRADARNLCRWLSAVKDTVNMRDAHNKDVRIRIDAILDRTRHLKD